MVFNPENFSTSEEAPKEETAEGAAEKEERFSKSTKAIMAISFALLKFGGSKLLEHSGMGKEEFVLSEEDREKIKKKGRIATMAESAAETYKMINKIEGAIFEDKWDELFDVEESTKKQKV